MLWWKLGWQSEREVYGKSDKMGAGKGDEIGSPKSIWTQYDA